MYNVCFTVADETRPQLEYLSGGDEGMSVVSEVIKGGIFFAYKYRPCGRVRERRRNHRTYSTDSTGRKGSCNGFGLCRRLL